MTKRMLIDASHPEQTRVAVIDGNRIDDLDFESAARRQLKGNIYLAKVTRIEPSLQAAFVEYGGNRHGFLSFAEIHPDYYRLPVADRERLEAMLADAMSPRRDQQPNLPPIEGSAPDLAASGTTEVNQSIKPLSPFDGESENPAQGAGEGGGPAFSIKDWLGADTNPAMDSDAVSEAEEIAALPLLRQERAPLRNPSAEIIEAAHDPLITAQLEPSVGQQPMPAENNAELSNNASDGNAPALYQAQDIHADMTANLTETIDGADDVEPEDDDEEDEGTAADDSALRRLRQRFLRHYKIQEVIKRRQVMLVQVVKEERGNKGAALTTYLSLPGRYCVLMPNSPRGGGVSRKVTNPGERKRLKEILDRLDIPQGMSVILRTAGIERSDAEIRRDFEYLMRLWDTIREMTLQSTAPALIYEEGNLIKRSIRDLYDSHIGEILVQGEEGYKHASNFMQMLMPNHVNRIVHYQNPVPLFFRYQVESQIETLDSPIVQLRSGGYLVINPTEALVSIDVNSGRSTRERDIEETALRTNLEAVDEIARQLRLRDLAGLVVIDLIDMEDGRNNAAVERRIKEAMKGDRARLQIGRISAFGLLELSRQRLRPSLLETNSEKCPHCNGLGYVKTTDTAALSVLRAIEEEGIRNRAAEVAVYLPMNIALHILNHKRTVLADIEARYGFQVLMRGEDNSIGQAFRIEKIRSRSAGIEGIAPVPVSSDKFIAPDNEPTSQNREIADDEDLPENNSRGEENRDSPQRDGRNRRRRGRGGRNRGERQESANSPMGDRNDRPRGERFNNRSPRGERPESGRPNRPWHDAQPGSAPQTGEAADQAALQDAAIPAFGASDDAARSVQPPRQPQGGDELSENRMRRRRGRRGGRRRNGERNGPSGERFVPPGGEAPDMGLPPNLQDIALESPSIVPPDMATASSRWQQNRPPRQRNEPQYGGGRSDGENTGNFVPPPINQGFEIDTTPQEPAPPRQSSRPALEDGESTEQDAARAAENINQAPDKPRSGWWRRLTGA